MKKSTATFQLSQGRVTLEELHQDASEFRNDKNRYPASLVLELISLVNPKLDTNKGKKIHWDNLTEEELSGAYCEGVVKIHDDPLNEWTVSYNGCYVQGLFPSQISARDWADKHTREIMLAYVNR